MKHRFNNTIVIALGGSILYPEEIDTKFIKQFASLIKQFVKKGKRFVIVTGGGRVSRLYQKAAGEISKITNEDKDWIGIHATRLNAHLLRTVFRDIADPIVFDSRHKRKKLKYPVTIASGWRPGWSTDFIAVALAVDYGVSEIVVAGKPSHVYDKDFVKHKDAKLFEALSWKKYRTLVPQKWTPGFHSPVDPVGARLAERSKIRAIVMDGRDLKNFTALIQGKEFQGTIIS
ncbi:MAG: UMP kinase [Patescibacteria group bacterium]